MSRTFTKLLFLALLLVAGHGLAQTKINPATQINWPLITGAGTPTSLGIGCTSVNYGQPFQNTAVTPNTFYTCGTDGWQIRGGGGGGGAGITIGSTHVPDGGSITNAPGFNSGTADAFSATPTPCQSGQYQYGSDASGNALCTALPAQPSSQYIAPQALSGCGVEYVSGLTYTVGACTYSINNVTYNSPLTTITLPAADSSNPEIDVIYVDVSQTVQFVQGTPASSPQQPTVDPSTQLPLTFVLVPTASTTPADTTLVDIYLEGTEWTPGRGGTSATSVNLTSTNFPYQGTHDVEFGATVPVATTTFAQFLDPFSGTVDLANYNTLVFYVRNKAAWPSTRSVTLQWYNGSTAKGTAVVLSNGSFGFNATSNTTAYQQLSIPLSTFGLAGVPVTALRYTVSGTGASLTGFYLDDVTLQGGVGQLALPSTLVNFKGTWNSTASYNPYDMVVSAGIGYVALTANTNVALTNTLVWASLSTSTTGAVTTTSSLVTNVLPKATGPSTIGNSSVSDDGTNVTTTEHLRAPDVTTTGSGTNGYIGLTAQGASSVTPGTGEVVIEAPNSVTTPYKLDVPATPPPDSTHTLLSCTFANPSICSWAANASSGLNQLTGDVNAGPGTGSQVATIQANAVTTAKINNAAVTYAKMQNVSANSVLLGAGASGAGAPPVEIALGTNLSMIGNTLNAAGGSGGVQYGTITRHVTIGDSLFIVATHDSSQELTVTGESCDATNCVSTFSGAAPAWLVVGNRVQFRDAWSPSCITWANKIISAVTSSTFTVDELLYNTPGEGGQGGCTGVISGSGGTAYNAENLAPSQAMKLPYFTNGGTVVPTLYNRNWPGQPLATTASNIASLIGDLNPDTTSVPTELWIQTNDQCGDFSSASWKADIATILTYGHAHGWTTNLMTVPNGPIYCGLGPGTSVNFYINNQWMDAQQCNPGNTFSNAPCADRVVDTWGMGLNDWSDPLLVQQSGPVTGHLTTAGAGVMASIMNMARVPKARPRGQATPGLGQNWYNSTQQAPSFQMPDQAVAFKNNYRGTSGLEGIEPFFSFEYNGTKHIQFDWQTMSCFNNSDTISWGDGSWNCIGPGQLAPGWTAFDDGLDNSGNPTYGGERGGIQAQQWAPLGVTSNPTFLRSGQQWYRSDLQQPCYYDTGATAHCGWSGGGTTTNAMTANSSGGAAPGTTFDGSVARTFDYHSFGAPGIGATNAFTGPNSFTASPTGPTPTGGDSTTKFATTAFVQAAIAAASTGAGIVTYSGPSLTFSGTQYFPIGGGGLASSTETNVDIDSPAAVTIQNMTVQMSAAPGVGNSVVYTWRKNASSQTLTCTISGASATSCSDTTHSFTTASLDLLDIQAVTTGTIVGTPTVVMAAQVGVASTAGVSSVYGLTGAVNPTAHNQAAALNCADTSGSATVQVCNTSPTYTPAAGDWIIYTTTTANTGNLTINVNSLGNKSVAKWQGTTTLAANDILAGTQVLMTYDGTNWEASTIGNAPSGGSGGCMTPVTIATTGSANNINFTSIAQTCHTLVFDCQTSINGGSPIGVSMQLNGSSSTVYDYAQTNGGYTVTPVVATEQDDQTSALAGITIRRDGGFPTFIMTIPQYTFGAATFYSNYGQTCYGTGPACHGRIQAGYVAGEFRGGGAITSVKFFVTGDTFFDGTQCTMTGR